MPRITTTLDGQWDFTFLGNVDQSAVEIATIGFDEKMPVPGCFDLAENHRLKRGVAAYQRDLTLTPNSRYRLTFDAVNFFAMVYLDGELLGSHNTGYNRFAFDFKASQSATTLTVLVDNRFDETRSPMHVINYDWYQHGGIIRSVHLHELPDCAIDNVRATTLQLDPPKLQVVIDVSNESKEAKQPISVQLNDRELLSETADATTSSPLTYEFELTDEAIWSPDAPNLHELAVCVGNDSVTTRIGLRTVSVTGKDILLNGQPIKLHGVCRHELHPKTGNSLTDEQIETDLQLLQQLGCNCVRGTHYPMDERFIKRCDELGILFFCESLAWGNAAEPMCEPGFAESLMQQTRQMMLSYHNHPSIIMWSLLNEAASHDEIAIHIYEKTISMMRTIDNSRPITYASNKIPQGDLGLHLVDVISINTYPAWYTGELDELSETLDATIEKAWADCGSDKPIIISEIGAGAIPGWDDAYCLRWSESYQAKLLDMTINHLFETRSDIAGLTIWQFCDGLTTTFVPKALGRPRNYNNKGIVDEWRKPKKAFDVVAKSYKRLPGLPKSLS